MNFNYIVDKAEQGVAITVFFNEDATQEQKDKIGEELKKRRRSSGSELYQCRRSME